MRTARYAGPSVAEPLDDQVDFGGDLLLQRQRRGAGIGRLPVALDRKALADLAATDNSAFSELVKVAQDALKTKAAAAKA